MGAAGHRCGCGCCCQNFKVKVQSSACGSASPIPGASVTINLETETTDSAGIATFTSCPKPGDSISVTATGFNSVSGTVPSNCSQLTITLTKDPAYTCCGGACPLPSTITGTDSNATFTLTKTTFGGHTVYCGGYLKSVSGATADSCSGNDECIIDTIEMPVVYELDCTGRSLTVYWTGACCISGDATDPKYWPGTVGTCVPNLAAGKVCAGMETTCSVTGGSFSGTYCPLNLTVGYGGLTADCGACSPGYPTTGTVTFTP